MRGMVGRAGRIACAAAVVAGGALAAVPGTASAGYCNDETPLVNGGEEVSANVGPGVVFVGADVGEVKGTDAENFVCVESAPASVNTYVLFETSPGSPARVPAGCTVDVLGGGCDVPGARIGFSDADGTPVLNVNGVNVVADDACVVAVGTTC